MSAILSIVIPTKDRFETLSSLVFQLLSWNYDDFEIIIQDNSSNNEKVLELLEERKDDQRVKYFYNNTYLSAIDNCQLAFENSTGEYICFLGDDDGIISQSVPVARWMKEQNIDSLTCKHGNYFWPGYRVKNYGKKRSLAGTLSYRQKKGTIDFLNPIEELNVVLEAGGLIMNRITRVYHGIVSRVALNKVYEQTGTFFPGPVPDMTSSVALSFHVDKHVYLDYPLIIAGFSKNSMAGRGGKGKAHGAIETEKSLPPDTVERWSPEIPRYWAPKTIWPEGLLQALKLTGNGHLISNVNLFKVYAALYLDTPSYRAELIEFIKTQCTHGTLEEVEKEIKRQRSFNILGNARENLKTFSIIAGVDSFLGFTTIYSDTIEDALSQLEYQTTEYIRKNSNTFSDIVQQHK